MRSLNWFGYSIERIAAIYETDAAAVEAAKGLVSQTYIWTAFAVEIQQEELDKKYGIPGELL